jgi:starch phosphorylase
VTGWSIEGTNGPDNDSDLEVSSLYNKIEQVILPLFYQDPESYAQVMRSAIAINGSFFNTQRVMFQYTRNAYSPAADSAQPLP